MKLHTLLPPYGGKKRSKRVGRGNSSGRGNFSGRGMSGEKSRSGRVHYLGFEGGQMPLYRRLPKRGFTPLSKVRYQEVNLYSLNIFKDEKEITPEILYREGLIRKKDGKVKILGDGELEITLIVKAHKFSKRAKDEIVKKGGQAVEIGKKPQSDKGKEIKKKKEVIKEVIKKEIEKEIIQKEAKPKEIEKETKPVAKKIEEKEKKIEKLIEKPEEKKVEKKAEKKETEKKIDKKVEKKEKKAVKKEKKPAKEKKAVKKKTVKVQKKTQLKTKGKKKSSKL